MIWLILFLYVVGYLFTLGMLDRKRHYSKRPKGNGKSCNQFIEELNVPNCVKNLKVIV